MGYTRTQVRTALAEAKKTGRVTSGMAPDLRETALELERWGYLPLPTDADVDKRVRDWYIAQGLAAPMDGDKRAHKASTPEASPEPAVIMSAPPHDAALIAAEAALAAAQAALAYARAMTQPAA